MSRINSSNNAGIESATMAISNATAFSAAVTLTLSYDRVDKQVSIRVPGFTGTASGNPSSCVFAGALPSSLRPAENTSSADVMVWTAGARSDTIGKIKVATDGVVTIYRSAGEGGLWATGMGWDSHCISYLVP